MEKNNHDKIAIRQVKPHWLLKLQEKWALNSLWEVTVVLLAFSLAGSSVVFFRKALFYLMGFTENTPFWLKTVSYLALVLPIYQILLLFYGFLLGQFDFFWNKEKKMWKWIVRRFNFFSKDEKTR